MIKKLKIPFPILVEGKYDRARLDNLVDTNILTTDGFGIFKKTEKLHLLQSLSRKTPIIVLTDSDGAGKLIRSHITSAIPKDRLIQLYIPKIKGKEKRKTEMSAEGYLGVEGMENALLYDLLKPYEDEEAVKKRLSGHEITKADLYAAGLTGGENSAAARDALAARWGLPSGMTPNAFLSALRILCTREEFLGETGQKE